MYKYWINVQMAMKYKNVSQMYKWQLNIFLFNQILCNRLYILFIKNNLIIIMLFYNIQQMAVKYKKCTNGNEIFFIQSNIVQ